MEKAKVREIVKNYKLKKPFYFMLTEDLTEKQLSNAAHKVARGISPDEIIALMDTSLFSKGKDGYLLTENYLYSKTSKQKIPLDGIISYEMKKKDLMMIHYADGTQQRFFINIYSEFEDIIQRLIAANKETSITEERHNASAQTTSSQQHNAKKTAAPEKTVVPMEQTVTEKDSASKERYDKKEVSLKEEPADILELYCKEGSDFVLDDLDKAELMFSFDSQYQEKGDLFMNDIETDKLMNIFQLYYEAKDYPIALAILRVAAGRNHSFARYMLGTFYEQGLGVKKDLKTAMFWYQKSAQTPVSMESSEEETEKPEEKRIHTETLKELSGAPAPKKNSQKEKLQLLQQKEVQCQEENDYEALFQILSEKAELSHDPKDAAKLGEYYFYGMGTDPDREKALELCQKTMRNLEKDFRHCMELENIISQITFWDDDTLDLDDLRSALSDSYHFDGVKDDAFYFESLIEPAIKRGMDRDGLIWLYLECGKGYDYMNYPRGILRCYQAALDLGNDEAAYQLGNLYAYGTQVPCDLEKARDYYEAAARLGNEKATSLLEEADQVLHMNQTMPGTLCLLRGRTWFESGKYLKAYHMLINAAKQGESSSYTLLGEMFKDGKGVLANPKQAARFYEKGAAAKDHLSQYRLANMYLNGEGLKKTKETQQAGIDLLIQAAGDGDLGAAQLALADIYYKGSIVKCDLKKAAYWYEKAAENKIQKAQQTISHFYKKGLGVKKDRNKAKYWAEKAENQNGY